VSAESSGKPDAWKLARPVWGWGRGETPRPTPPEVDKKLSAYGEGLLGGGETEREFTERLSVAIWRANGAYCEVSVNATYLEELPSETYSLDEDDYARLIQGTAETLSTEEGEDSEEGEDEVVSGD